MIDSIVILIGVVENVLSLLIIAHVVLSYFMSPDNPIRETIDRLIDPILAPIRQVLPRVGMFDFSALVLLIGIQILASVLISILRSI